jgi:hypothetical protein
MIISLVTTHAETLPLSTIQPSLTMYIPEIGIPTIPVHVLMISEEKQGRQFSFTTLTEQAGQAERVLVEINSIYMHLQEAAEEAMM